MTLVAWLAGAAALLVVLTVSVWCVARARRLDRLHVRLDAARTGLAGALARRAEVASRVARLLGPAGADLAAVADRVSTVGETGREPAENELGRELAAVPHERLPVALHAELVDAEQLVVLARGVHNDAVRDTLALRSRRLVRWLRLAGRAPLPGYFEIVDPAAARSVGEPAPPPRRAAQQIPGREREVGPVR